MIIPMRKRKHAVQICCGNSGTGTADTSGQIPMMASRGYSTEKVDRIFASQLTEKVYREHCRVVIDNNGSVAETFAQIDRALSEKK